MRREHKQKHVLYDTRDIFVDAFDISDSFSHKLILEKIVNIVDKIKDGDIETNVKLLEWYKRKFHTKVMD